MGVRDGTLRAASEKTSHISAYNNSLLKQTASCHFPRSLECFCDLTNQCRAVERVIRQRRVIQVPGVAKVAYLHDERTDRHQQCSANESGLPLHPISVVQRNN